MNNYNKNSELFDKLSELTKKHNITFWTATQPPNPNGNKMVLIKNRPQRDNIVIIDHMDLIR